MGVVRRIERAAEQADAHPRRVRRENDAGRCRDHAFRTSRLGVPAKAGALATDSADAERSMAPGPGWRGLGPFGRDDENVVTA